MLRSGLKIKLKTIRNYKGYNEELGLNEGPDTPSASAKLEKVRKAITP